MKRKGLLWFFFLIGIVSTSACSMFNKTKSEFETVNSDKTVESSSSMASAKEKEERYNELSRNANSPKIIEHSKQFNQDISFVAKVEGEPKQIESKDETLNGQWYISIFLMRNRATPIYLNLSDIKKETWPKNGDILRITGTTIGYLYTSYKNERVDLLDIKAKKIKTLTPKNTDVPKSSTIETDQYRVEITETDTLLDAFGESSLVIYYNFKNKKESASIPPLRTYFFFSQKNEYLKNTILGDLDRLNPKALNRDPLEPDGEMLYYETFKLLNEETPIHLAVYDDEYNLLNTLEIAVPAKK
ncbi:DUF5067 domain-containing protein [Enterococcus ureasiticus]|uniref:DUF5067 domain-containing protein n=1 Tax=Enterococcus ureasiticus TaxID=903984 RepID=A0A1E5GML9_9ENTE|nr:DUF5067 domain-containing protein [Enterococcus ureasiticus]OEG13944.1 hypothetical protein BCR21_02845 [Enterococcus ureasiticus]